MKKTRHSPGPSTEDGNILGSAPDVVEKPVDGDARWRTLYKEAMIELDPQRVNGLVLAAMEEIARRSQVLEQHRDESEEMPRSNLSQKDGSRRAEAFPTNLQDGLRLGLRRGLRRSWCVAHQIAISPQSGSRSNRPCDGTLSARLH
jgi:hypothetical protein